MQILRYPPTKDRSLKAWNAADELILSYIQETEADRSNVIICNDRFGYLTCQLHFSKPQIVVNYKSQEKAVVQNLTSNHFTRPDFVDPLLSKATNTSLGIIKIPKSLDLFKLFLHQLHNKLNEDGIVICGFMTKYFTPQLIKIAEEYFENVTQTKAWKKARLMILSGKKILPKVNILEGYEWNNDTYKQYLGVFSAGHIDYATQFFLEHLQISDSDQNILDLASGNGVIAKQIREKKIDATIYLVDDSWLALESSKLNLTTGENYFHFNDTLDNIEDNSLDLIVSNPPFHFEFEPNIEITLSLFFQAKEKLRNGGHFQLVANRHLPYRPFLQKLFGTVEIIIQNDHFIIYKANK